MKLNLILEGSFKNEYKYYSFDFDDNIMTLPTKIKMKKDKEPIEVSSEDFAKIRTKIGEGSWELATDAFTNFRPEGDAQFIKDTEKPIKYGPVWSDFVKAVNNARIFSIITARGHSPSTIETAISNMIKRNQNGLSKDKCIGRINQWRNLAGMSPLQGDAALNYYLQGLCKFYPVSYPGLFGAEASDPSVAKTKAISLFMAHVKEKATEVGFKKGDPITMGFSDDDHKTFNMMLEFMKKSKQGFTKIHVINTGDNPETVIISKEQATKK